MRRTVVVIIIIMVISMCYFSREHVALPLKKRCDHRIRQINRLKALCMMQNNILNKQTMCLVQLYRAFVRPHLEFSNCVWSPSLKKRIEIIKSVQ